MRWGLVSLNGKVDDVQKLSLQLKKYTQQAEFNYVIGVDGGCALLQHLNVVPNLILGDFDSIDALSTYETLWPSAKILSFPVQKDYTDSELAIEVILKEKLDRVVIIGALGGRMDHMLGTLFLQIGRAHV